jgi:hypothetical protein
LTGGIVNDLLKIMLDDDYDVKFFKDDSGGYTVFADGPLGSRAIGRGDDPEAALLSAVP